jgi:hypothetical protein
MKVNLKLIPGLPRRELIEKIHFHHRQGEVAERALGFYLLDMQRRRLFKPGCHSAAHWALDRLDLKRADKLIKLAERMEVLPAIDRAFFQGEVPWTKIREIARVAVRETEAQWLELARSKTSREIEDAVLGLKRGALPGERLGLGRSFQVVRIPLIPEDHACWETAVRKLRRELGEGSTPRDALMAMVDMALRTDPEGKIPGRRERGEPVYTVVYHGGADGKSAWMETGKGRVEVDPESLREKVRSGARTIEALDVSGAGLCRAIRFGERGGVPKEERDGDIPPEVMAAVLARDSYRCVICRSDRGVTVHHLDSRADGGKADMNRLLSLCQKCHSDNVA